MPVTVNGQTYYRTAEACEMAGTSRNSFLRWIREGSFTDVEHTDRRGWRLFTEADLNRLRHEVNRIQKKRISSKQEDSLTSSR